MVSISVDDAKTRLIELIDAVEHGETIIITCEDTPVATLAPVAKSDERRPRFGSAKGSILYMADDFDAPLEDFNEYMLQRTEGGPGTCACSLHLQRA